MIRKRTRPQTESRARQVSPEAPDTVGQASDEEGDEKLPLHELLELRKLRKSRQGIDAARLNKGDVKRKKKKRKEEGVEEAGGLNQTDPTAVLASASTSKDAPDSEEDDEERDARARRTVRANNFTGQTNVLDVDKHMMAYIEENIKLHRGGDSAPQPSGPLDPHEELYRVSDRLKVGKKTREDGSVANSIGMLTAIPEVDLGMDTRLKNIEDTEKAKRDVAERPKTKVNNDEAHLAASRYYQPNLRQKSDADIMRDAKLEAMGMPPQTDAPQRKHAQEQTQMATDELVMERFKKRMRKN